MVHLTPVRVITGQPGKPTYNRQLWTSVTANSTHVNQRSQLLLTVTKIVQMYNFYAQI